MVNMKQVICPESLARFVWSQKFKSLIFWSQTSELITIVTERKNRSQEDYMTCPEL